MFVYFPHSIVHAPLKKLLLKINTAAGRIFIQPIAFLHIIVLQYLSYINTNLIISENSENSVQKTGTFQILKYLSPSAIDFLRKEISDR